MNLKKSLSVVLAVLFILASFNAVSGVIVGAADYSKAVIKEMYDNGPAFRQDRYTESSWSAYTSARNAANTVYGNSSATADQITAAATTFAGAAGGLQYKNAAYVSGLVLIAPSTVVNGATASVKFKDAGGKACSDITVGTVENATVSAFALSGGYYTATVSATGETGSLISVPVTYTCEGATYDFFIYILVSAAASSTADKTALGAKIAFEYGFNRQSRNYDSGFTTYQQVLCDAVRVYANPTSTQTKVDRAVENIDMAVASLVTNRADYSEIYELLARYEALNRDDYTSLVELDQAVAWVEYDLSIENQYIVDNAASAIRSAFESLTLKTSRYTIICLDENGNELQRQRLDGTRSYIVRVPAPEIPGYTPDEQYRSIKLTQDENEIIFNYTPTEYIVHFNPNSGYCEIESKVLTFGETYGDLPECTRDGYTFLGWYTNVHGGDRVTADTLVTVNYAENLYAAWSDVERYTIKMHGVGGVYRGLGDEGEDVTETTFSGVYGTDLELPEPYLYGYQFLGYYSDAAYNTPFNFDVMPDLGDNGDVFNVYAKWVERTYDVTLDPGENGVVNPATKSVTYNSTYGVLPTPEKEGHTFIGWFTQPGDEGTQVDSMTRVTEENTHSIYAHYSVNTYTLYFNMNGGAEIEPITALYGTPIVLENTPTKENYLFKGWTLNNGNEFELTTMPAGNITINAVWTLNTVCEYYLDAYKTVDGVKIPARNVLPGETITVDVSIKTNYLTGMTVYGILFDKTVFGLTGTAAARVVTVNSTSDYMATLSSKAISGNLNWAATNWGELIEGDPELNTSDFQCMRLTTTAYKTAGTLPPVALTEKTLIFSFDLVAKTAITKDKGIVTLDERMTVSPERQGNKYSTKAVLQRWNDGTQNYSTQDSINLVPDVTHARLDIPVVTENAELGAIPGSTTVIDYERDYVYGLAEKLTLNSFKTDYAKVIGNGTIECDDSVLRTGSVIRVMNNGVCRVEYTVVIYGDIDSNGKADATDAYFAQLCAMGMLTPNQLTAAQLLAGDVDRSGSIDMADVDIISDAGLLKQTVAQF